jgi:hypothetical protein
MKTKAIAARALLAGLLSAATPSLAHATPGDAHDDATYPTYATEAVQVPGPLAGPRAALAQDDATYPEVAADEAQQAGIAIAFTGGPEAYAHDDVTYGAAPVEPALDAEAAATVAVTAPVDSTERGGR